MARGGGASAVEQMFGGVGWDARRRGRILSGRSNLERSLKFGGPCADPVRVDGSGFGVAALAWRGPCGVVVGQAGA